MNVRCASVNVNGVASKKTFLEAASLRDGIDILAVQEHLRYEDA